MAMFNIAMWLFTSGIITKWFIPVTPLVTKGANLTKVKIPQILEVTGFFALKIRGHGTCGSPATIGFSQNRYLVYIYNYWFIYSRMILIQWTKYQRLGLRPKLQQATIFTQNWLAFMGCRGKRTIKYPVLQRGPKKTSILIEDFHGSFL
jgi:hypothetical protein